jgi:hypothetical protein
LVKTVKSVTIAEIKPIVKTKKGYTGGLSDLGNFREGFCFKVALSDGPEWVMCSANLTDKEAWMVALAAIKGS